MTNDKIALSEYLFRRALQLDVHHIFGVPGDFNLPLLDYIEDMDGVEWVGCCNELNAAYAADGYGRIKGAPGFLVTTYGVGELSALNGIGGSRAESVPIVHIVGMTGRPIQEKNLVIHHVNHGDTLGVMDHLIYTKTSDPLSCCTEIVTDPSKAPEQMDRVISEVVKKSAPGYIYLPADMFGAKVDGQPLKSKLDLEVAFDAATADKLADDILELVYAAKNPSILVDTLTSRFRAEKLARDLSQKTNFHSFTTSLAKGSIDETAPQFVGVYNGKLSTEGIADAMHASDLVLNIGPLLSDSNTGGFTREIKDEHLVMFHPLFVQIKGKRHPIPFKPVLERVVERIDLAKIPTPGPKPVVGKLEHTKAAPGFLSMTELVESISGGLRPHDTVLVESGTFQFASQDLAFKEDTAYISQIFYSSIGFTLPATLGAAIARKEQNHPGRVILVEGDGSAQMTIQELGTMVRQGLKPVVFLLNNDGYSIERAIWGPERGYNDICPGWQWTKLLEAFGGTEKTVANHRVTSKQQLDELLAGDGLDVNKMHMVEVLLEKFDYPWRLKGQVKGMMGNNFRMFKEYAAAHGEI